MLFLLLRSGKKLQPFFPPLAPLQSINLRAALFRSLNGLKNDGVLGREIVLRKTMLDECKGEKYEEALSAFSTVVLHRVLSKDNERSSAIARRLALAPKLEFEERKSLLPLAIAHRASLTAILHRKEQQRLKYLQFRDLLNEKENKLSRKLEGIRRAEKTNPSLQVPDHSLQAIRQRFDTHWQGDPRWLDILMKGDPEYDQDLLFETPFSETWKHVVDGRLLPARADAQKSNKQDGLLRNLEIRVAAQQTRLQRWRQYHEELTGETKASQGIILGDALPKPTSDFSAHKTIDNEQRDALQRPLKPPLYDGHAPVLPADDEYAQLIKSMQQDLDEVDAPKRALPAHMCNEDFGQGSQCWPRSDLSDSRIQFADGQRTGEQLLNHGNPNNNRESLLQIPRKTAKETPGTGRVEPDQEVDTTMSPSRMTKTTLDAIDQSSSNMSATAIDAGPSPVRTKPSLVERTRQSMAAASPTDSHRFRPEKMSQTEHRREVSLNPPFNVEDNATATLLERTRRSMSLLTAQPKGHRKSMNRHRQFPTNQFETPKRQTPIPEDSEDMTPPEQLFSKDADYASVFKSRPKIAMSPTNSPAPEDSPSSMNASVCSTGDDDHDFSITRR